MEHDIILKALELVVMIVILVITKYLIPFLKGLVKSDDILLLYTYANTFVKAAEQIYHDRGLGEDKLNYVTELLTQKAKDLNLDISENDIRAIIEEAVLELKKEL